MKELMDYAKSNGIIDLSEAAKALQMEKLDEFYLSKHHNRIYYDERCKKYRTLINDGIHKKVPVKKSTEEAVRNAVIDYYKQLEANNALTVGKAIREFIEYHYVGETAIATKERNLADIKRFFGDIESESLSSFTSSSWGVYLEDYVKAHKPKRRAFTNACCLLRKTLLYHRKRGHIDIDVKSIFEELELRSDDFSDSRKDDLDEVFTLEESKTLVSYLWKNHTDPVCLLLLLLYFTGIRVGEAMALRHEDVFDDYIYIHSTAIGAHHDESGNYIRNAVKSTTKTPKGTRRLPLSEGSEMIIEALRAMNPDSEYIFVNKGGEIYSRNAVGCKLNRICKKLGITPKSPHKLRKTYCSILKESGVDDASITALMGHADISTTNTYYVKNRNNIVKLADRIKNISELDAAKMVAEG